MSCKVSPEIILIVIVSLTDYAILENKTTHIAITLSSYSIASEMEHSQKDELKISTQDTRFIDWGKSGLMGKIK